MAYRVKFEVEGFQCLRCEYKWVPRVFKGKKEEPTICPKCKSPYWNKPRRVAKPLGVAGVRKRSKKRTIEEKSK